MEFMELIDELFQYVDSMVPDLWMKHDETFHFAESVFISGPGEDPGAAVDRRSKDDSLAVVEKWMGSVMFSWLKYLVGGFGTCFMFPYIGFLIIPIDSYFSEGWPNHQPDTCWC